MYDRTQMNFSLYWLFSAKMLKKYFSVVFAENSINNRINRAIHSRYKVRQYKHDIRWHRGPKGLVICELETIADYK